MPTSTQARFTRIMSEIPDGADRVLDVGCARHSEEQRKRGNLHERLSQRISGELVGIDIEEDEVEKMRKNGFNVRVGDAEKLDIEGSFDVVVAGEVIEHLRNPGTFLERARDKLHRGGRVVLSTPNPDGFVYFRKALTGQKNNPTHTCWIDPHNLRALVDSMPDLKHLSFEYVPPTGGVSKVLWKLGYRRASSPDYVATLEKT